MVDKSSDRMRQVLDHWEPRIEVAGISLIDARRVVSRCEGWNDWCRAWTDEGDRHVELAEEASSKRRFRTAGDAYRRASLFYHFAQFMFFEDLSQKEEAARRKTAAYAKGAEWFAPPAEAVMVPFGDGSLRGYMRRPEGCDSVPLVVIVPGSDSTKEEFSNLERYFLERGMATFSFDGPGQGEGRSLGFLKPDWSSVVEQVVAEVRERDGLNRQVALFGMAFGGHLVMQGAPAVRDLSGVVCMNGFHDMGHFWNDLPSVYRSNMRFALGGASADETADRARQFSLEGRSAPTCPLLVIHGGRDRIFPVEEAQRLGEMSGSRGVVKIYPEGNHVCNNLAYEYRSLAADWLDEQFRLDQRHGL